MKNHVTTLWVVGLLWSFATMVAPSSAWADQCQQQACKKAYEDAKFNCDEKNNAAIQNVSSLAGLTSTSMGQSGAESAQASCGQTNDLSNQASNALQSYKMQCQQAIDKCTQACQQYVDKTKSSQKCKPLQGDAQQAQQKCTADYMPKVQQAQQGIDNYASQQEQATSCKNETNGESKMPEMQLPQSSGNTEEKKEEEKEKTYCEQNPDFMGCKTQEVVDCSNPSQATTNKTCVCAANPNDPMCGLNAGTVAAQNLGVAQDPASQKSTTTTRADELPGRSVKAQEVNTSSGGSSSSGSGSAGASSSGGGGMSSSPSSQSAAKSKDPDTAGGTTSSTSTSASDSGGGGGGGWGGSLGSSDDSSAGAVGAFRAPSSSGAKKDEKLRDYLPGGANDPSRLAGNSDDKKRVDGITGPHSDQWRKIKFRYQVISPSLIEQP